MNDEKSYPFGDTGMALDGADIRSYPCPWLVDGLVRRATDFRFVVSIRGRSQAAFKTPVVELRPATGEWELRE